MNTGNIVRDQLLNLLRGGNAHTDFKQVVDGYPVEMINVRPPHSSYTPWRLVEHMRIAQWDILEFIRNPQHVSPPWPEGYWPPEEKTADQPQWETSIAGFLADLQAMQELVENPETDLYASLPYGEEYTILREVLVLADHNAYHLGELSFMRGILK
jgi:hypothetical protein